MSQDVKDLLERMRACVTQAADIRNNLNSISADISVMVAVGDMEDIEIQMGGSLDLLVDIMVDMGEQVEDVLDEDLRDLEKTLKIFRKLLTSLDRALDNLEE